MADSRYVACRCGTLLDVEHAATTLIECPACGAEIDLHDHSVSSP